MKLSPSDSKKYRPLTLNNGLRVLLIQNTHSLKSAAALCVNAGHFDDPAERQGLAHFLEHMLFLGTKKYPKSGEFSQFIAQYGGSNNAWTGTEHTNFFFDIHHTFFTQALDRFSQFFIAPLLSQQFVAQERNNVDAEFKLKLKDDIRRLYDVHKETINPKHPFAKFSVGNIETLADRENEPVQQALIEFYQTYYHANLMTLALEGPQSLDALETLVKEYFSSIPKGVNNKAPINTPLYLDTQLAVKIQVKPEKQDRKLIVSFAMPAIDSFYLNKPELYLSYLLGHEGPGSLLSCLKGKGWAVGLTAGGGINGSNFKDFNIGIQLTKAGNRHTNDIISIVFNYIKLIKNQGIQSLYFSEKQTIAKISFLHHEMSKPIDSVSQLVVNMQHYPVEDYVYGDYAMEEFNVNEIEILLTYFQPNNMRIVHVANDVETNNISHWYKVPYQIDAIDNEWLKTWENYQLNSALKLPEENPYIVSDPIVENIEASVKDPELIEDSNGIKIWHKQDELFATPKGHIFVGIDIPISVTSTQNIAMTRLFVDLFSDMISEENYSAELAGIHYHLYSHQGGLTLQLAGLSEKQPKLLYTLLSQMFSAQFTESHFLLFKQHLIQHWRNADKSKAISQLFAVISTALQPHNAASDDLADSLLTCTLSDFNHFIKTLFNQINVEALIFGNWRKTQAINIAKNVTALLKTRSQLQHKVNCPVVDLAGHCELIFPLVLPKQEHAAVLYYPFANKNESDIAIAMTLSHLLAPTFFQTMRTEKQLGYLVGVGYVPVNRYPGIAFYIQSPHMDSIDLVNEIDDFVKQISEILSQIPENDWLHLKHGLIGQLEEKDTSLRVTSQRLWMSITNNDHTFSHKKALVAAIDSLTLLKLQQFCKQQLNNKAANQRLTVISLKKKKEITKENQQAVVTDVGAFIAESAIKY